MDQFVNKTIDENGFIFKRSLDKIIDKYSKLQHEGGGIEVDLNNTHLDALEHYMNLSVKELSSLQSTSLSYLSEESLSAQDISGDSQLDITYKDGRGDETCGSTNQFAEDANKAYLSLFDTSLRSFSEGECQPEDQDEVLQMSLSSNGSSLVELYPSMVSRLERAWHQQHVSVAADSVLRRYRRWRQQSKRRDLNNTFDVTLKHTDGNPKRLTSKERTNSRIKRKLVMTETTPHSALQTVTSLHDGQQSHMEKDLLRRELSPEIRVIDFSNEPMYQTTHEPKESLLNETFTVCELSPSNSSQQGEHVSICTAEASVGPFFRLKRFPDSSHSSQRATYSTYDTETAAVKERADIYNSPVRQSPSKLRLMASISRSPHLFSRSPQKDHCSQEPMRPRVLSSSLSSYPEKPVVQLKLLQVQDSIQPSQPQLHSPHSARAADGQQRRRRNLSFDSFLSSNPASYSPKKVDEDFLKLYHKFACQNKSPFFNGPPCRLCAKNSTVTSRSHSSSSLAALALSPHRSVLRKRYRELEWDRHSQSKRFRQENCTSSPGSKRHRREMLMQRLSLPELTLPNRGLSYSPGKQHQEAWMSRHRPASDAHFFLGGSLEKRGASGYFPR
ncbi:uncharacterized protein si:dkeyp-117h8.4 isoform X2 [Melanotaenia boesemani]|uniref:uncharacterized protein si:dkeyp-117h8.4 isoform X2 n=1 Tax=Melanotaenia boesemani TaxID=1250792 RepID=UPI001C0431D6|nr:uncharacterized protein si:dkeyp-117h8.4 isoform X2 [Melanotaenia boesemani]